MALVVVAGSAGGVCAVTEVVVSKPGPGAGFPGDAVGVTSRTDTLIGPRSFLLVESMVMDRKGYTNGYQTISLTDFTAVFGPQGCAKNFTNGYVRGAVYCNCIIFFF